MIIGKFIIWFCAFIAATFVCGIAAMLIARFILAIIKMFSEKNVDKK